MAFAVPMAASEISYFQADFTDFVHADDVGFAARAPPLAVANVEVTGGVTVMRGGAFALHVQETVAALFGFDANFIAPNGGADNIVNGQRLSRQLSAEEAAGVRIPQEISGYADHGLKQLQGRDGGVGVSDAALADAWNNPVKIEYTPTQYGPTFRLTGRDAVVVVNPQGEVVTTWALSSSGVR